MSNLSKVKDLFGAMFSSLLGSNQDAITETDRLFGDVYTLTKGTADSMASDTTAVTALPWRQVRYAAQVTAIYVHPTAALTGHASNNAVITISKYDAAGANKTTLGTLTTTASWVAGTRVAFTLTAANLAIVEGGSIAIEIAKGASGVVVPISEYVVYAKRT